MNRDLDLSDELLPTLKLDVVREILASPVSGPRQRDLIDRVLYAQGWTAHHVARRVREEIAS